MSTQKYELVLSVRLYPEELPELMETLTNDGQIFDEEAICIARPAPKPVEPSSPEVEAALSSDPWAANDLDAAVQIVRELVSTGVAIRDAFASVPAVRELALTRVKFPDDLKMKACQSLGDNIERCATHYAHWEPTRSMCDGLKASPDDSEIWAVCTDCNGVNGMHRQECRRVQ